MNKIKYFSILALCLIGILVTSISGCEKADPTPPENLFAPGPIITTGGAANNIEGITNTLTPAPTINDPAPKPTVKVGDSFALLISGYIEGSSLNNYDHEYLELLRQDGNVLFFKALEATTDYGVTFLSFKYMASVRYFYIKIE